MKFFPRKNGNVIVDATTVDLTVDGLVSIDVEKCPNLYGTAYNVWESNDLATIFGVATTVEPLGTLVYASVLGNNYYDTFTGTITVGTGSDITITNTGETAVDIYVVDLTTLFTTEPTETQCDSMAKMFLFNGTGSELITLEEVFYVDYTGQVIHNLTDIYGTGNEPTLETHESLIPQYTNTVLKAKAFENTLQQEYMQLSLDTPVYEGLSLRDIFEDGNMVNNGDGTSLTGWSTIGYASNLRLVNGEIVYDTVDTGWSAIKYDISLVAGTDYYIAAQVYADNQISGLFNRLQLYTPNVVYYHFSPIYTTKTIESTILTALTTANGSIALRNDLSNNTVRWDNVMFIPMSLFTTIPTQAQLDEWLDIYLTLTSANSKTGTAFVQDRFYIDYDNAKAYDYNIIEPYLPTTLDTIVYEGKSYRDIFETTNLILNSSFDNGTTDWLVINGTGLSNVDNELVAAKYNTTGTFGTKGYIPVVVGEQFYMNYDAKYKTIIEATPSVYSYFRVGTNFVSNYSETFNLTSEFNNFSDILTATATTSSVGLHFRIGGNISTEIVIDNLYLIRLNIFSVPPTKEQLDEWLSTYLYLSNKTAVMEDVLDKTITLSGIPDKMWIEKDRVVILGSYVVVGE